MASEAITTQLLQTPPQRGAAPHLPANTTMLEVSILPMQSSRAQAILQDLREKREELLLQHPELQASFMNDDLLNSSGSSFGGGRPPTASRRSPTAIREEMKLQRRKLADRLKQASQKSVGTAATAPASPIPASPIALTAKVGSPGAASRTTSPYQRYKKTLSASGSLTKSSSLRRQFSGDPTTATPTTCTNSTTGSLPSWNDDELDDDDQFFQYSESSPDPTNVPVQHLDVILSEQETTSLEFYFDTSSETSSTKSEAATEKEQEQIRDTLRAVLPAVLPSLQTQRPATATTYYEGREQPKPGSANGTPSSSTRSLFTVVVPSTCYEGDESSSLSNGPDDYTTSGSSSTNKRMERAWTAALNSEQVRGGRDGLYGVFGEDDDRPSNDRSDEQSENQDPIVSLLHRIKKAASISPETTSSTPNNKSGTSASNFANEFEVVTDPQPYGSYRPKSNRSARNLYREEVKPSDSESDASPVGLQFSLTSSLIAASRSSPTSVAQKQQERNRACLLSTLGNVSELMGEESHFSRKSLKSRQRRRRRFEPAVPSHDDTMALHDSHQSINSAPVVNQSPMFPPMAKQKKSAKGSKSVRSGQSCSSASSVASHYVLPTTPTAQKKKIGMRNDSPKPIPGTLFLELSNSSTSSFLSADAFATKDEMNQSPGVARRYSGVSDLGSESSSQQGEWVPIWADIGSNNDDVIVGDSDGPALKLEGMDDTDDDVGVDDAYDKYDMMTDMLSKISEERSLEAGSWTTRSDSQRPRRERTGSGGSSAKPQPHMHDDTDGSSSSRSRGVAYESSSLTRSSHSGPEDKKSDDNYDASPTYLEIPQTRLEQWAKQTKADDADGNGGIVGTNQNKPPPILTIVARAAATANHSASPPGGNPTPYHEFQRELSANGESLGWSFPEPSDLSSWSSGTYSGDGCGASLCLIKATEGTDGDDTQPKKPKRSYLVVQRKPNVRSTQEDITERFAGGHYHIAVISGLMKSYNDSEV